MANPIRNIPPSHEKSHFIDDIFFPKNEPKIIAINPEIKAETADIEGFISLNPQLNPVDAESRELASASAAASAAERTFEQSKSAAVSSR